MDYRAGLAFLLAALGCAEPQEPYTWGDGVSAVVDTHCHRVFECGLFTVKQRTECWSRNMDYFCEFQGGCDVELPEEAYEAQLVCTQAYWDLPDEYCLMLWFGLTPVACNEFWDYNPTRKE